jgi:AraC-like DNA-binding protein
MTTVSQEQAIDRETLSSRDQVAFWRDPRWSDLECLHATFVQHAYAQHTHDTFVIGVIESGVECYRLKGNSYRAVAGDVCVVNPGEPHDGSPGDTGYRYRMFYPDAALMSDLQTEVTERAPGEVHFRDPLFQDPAVYRLLSGAHAAMESAVTHLERDTAFLEAATLLIRRYAERRAPEIRIGSEAEAVARVCDYAEDHIGDELDLERLAALAGFSRYRLIRSFRRERGMTPHAWVTGRRVARARGLLAAGERPAEVAVACGFYDQAHLTRHFKGITGVTPARYRAAFLQ